MTCWTQPPDAENRMSGGVGELTGAIPLARPNPSTLSSAPYRVPVPKPEPMAPPLSSLFGITCMNPPLFHRMLLSVA